MPESFSVLLCCPHGSHAINLLSNISTPCLDVLIDVPGQPGQEEYGGKNMAVVQVLLDFMEKRVDRVRRYMTEMMCATDPTFPSF